MTEFDASMEVLPEAEEIVAEAVAAEVTATEETGADPMPYAEEAEAVRAVYPAFDLEAELAHPVMGKILRGEGKPSLKQIYEAVHLEEILEGRISEGVSRQLAEAVSRAVEAALAEHEQKMLSHIRARGRRPAEVGAAGGAGIRMHPAVNRLTRKERAMLAKRAENGETIQF